MAAGWRNLVAPCAAGERQTLGGRELTQFMILTGPRPSLAGLPGVSAVAARECPVAELAESVLGAAAEESWYLRASGNEYSEELCVAANAALSEGRSFASTELARLLTSYLPSARQISFWYASDCADLPEFEDADVFLAAIEAQVRVSPPEIYARYRMPFALDVT